MKDIPLGSLLIGSVLGFSATLAEARTLPEDLLNLSLEELTQIKISGPSRTLQTLSDVPASVTVFQRRELRSMGIDFLYELLSFVPGLQTSRDNNYGAAYFYSARGSSTAQETTSILLLIDGVPRQEVRSTSAISGLLPLDRIERIEIIRGPGSALYGSGAFLGIINIISVKGNNLIKIQPGEPDRQQLEGQLNVGSGNWELDAFLYDYRDQGEAFQLNDRLGDELKPTTDPQQASNAVINLRYRDTQLTWEHFRYSSQQFYSIGAISNPVNESENSYDHISLRQNLDFGALQTTLQVSYTASETTFVSQGTEYGELAAISNPSSNAPLVADVLYESHDLLLQWLNDWHINTDNTLQFGLEKKHEEITTARLNSNYDTVMLANMEFPVDYSASRDIRTNVLETGGRNIYGVYAQLQHRFGNSTSFTLGSRYDDYTDFDGQFSLRLAMIKELQNEHYLKLFYGEAFRAPGFNQLNIKESVTVARNPDLEAETIRSTELVWLKQTTDYTVSTSVFYNILENQITTRATTDGKSSAVNEDAEYSSGIELEGSVQLSPQWLIRAGYTRFFTLPDRADRESDQLASIIAHYQRADWWFNLAGYYNSDRDMAREELGPVDAFTVLNAKLGFLLSNDITTTLQVKNLLAEDAASVPQNINITTPIPYRGRELSIGLEIQL